MSLTKYACGIIALALMVAVATTGCERKTETYAGIDPSPAYPESTEKIDPHTKR